MAPGSLASSQMLGRVAVAHCFCDCDSWLRKVAWANFESQPQQAMRDGAKMSKNEQK